MDILGPAQVEEEIIRLSKLLEHATTELARRARRAAEAETDFKLGIAKATMRSGAKTVAEREAEALQICEPQYREAKVAAALLLSAQEASRNYRAQLSAMQSVYRAIAEHSGLR